MTGYPISTVSYVLVCSKYKDADDRRGGEEVPHLRRRRRPAEADALGFAPLPSRWTRRSQPSIATIS